MKARLLALVTRGLGLLPLSAERAVGRLLGALAWRLGRESAHTTLTNLGLCFPELGDAERRRLARESLEHTGMLFAESGAVLYWPEARWRRLVVTMEGAELLDPAPDGRGTLVLVPHIGNWEYLALILGRYRVTALYDRPRFASVEGLIHRGRSRTGATLLPIDAGGLRAFYRALAGGGLVALLPDQVPARRAGVYAPFFRQRALTMTFVHRLLRSSPVRVLFAAALRCPGGFEVRIAAAEDPRLEDPDPVVSASAMNEAIESLVRAAPAQYQWEYKRFKRQPPGCPSPYRRSRANGARTPGSAAQEE